MRTKLMQNRIIVLGEDRQDAHHYSGHRAFKDSLDSPDLITSSSSRTMIEGGVGGMHVKVVYITPTAHRGANYDVARNALARCLARTGGKFKLLHGDGTTTDEL